MGRVLPAICSLLFLPLCMAMWDDDRGYQQLCGQKYQCSCSTGISENFVDCSLRNISTIPSNIYFPGQIDKVLFRNNQITDVLAHTFYNGHSVTELDMSYNRIKFIASSSFLAFEKLTKLYLSHNELTSLPVKLLDGLGNLKTLDLSFNKIQTFLSNVFEPTPQLVELKLKFNPLLDLDGISFEHLPRLDKLEIENTGLSKLPDSIFTYTPRLTSLSLASNEFTEVPIRAVSKCKELKTLDISENSIKILMAGAFHGLNSLTKLYMSGQRGLTEIHEGAFGDLTNLKVLQCSYNTELTYLNELAFYRIIGGEKDGVRMVGPLHLEQLHMRDNALQYIGNILKWKDLSYLDLRGNPFKCDCNLRWVADELPNILKENIRCATPPSLANVPISKVHSAEFVCSWYIFTDNIVIFIALLMAFVFLFCWVLFLSVYFFCKLKIKVKSNSQLRYKLIVPKTDRIDLEWDHSADP